MSRDQDPPDQLTVAVDRAGRRAGRRAVDGEVAAAVHTAAGGSPLDPSLRPGLEQFPGQGESTRIRGGSDKCGADWSGWRSRRCRSRPKPSRRAGGTGSRSRAGCAVRWSAPLGPTSPGCGCTTDPTPRSEHSTGRRGVHGGFRRVLRPWPARHDPGRGTGSVGPRAGAHDPAVAARSSSSALALRYWTSGLRLPRPTWSSSSAAG